MADKFFGDSSSDLARRTYDHVEPIAPGSRFELGEYNSSDMLNDPKRIGFLFARYKFVAKMLAGQTSVFEIGCQEGLGTAIVSKEVQRLVAADFFRPHIESCRSRLAGKFPNIRFVGHDITSGPLDELHDAGYSLDVLEHVDPRQEDLYMKHICASLTKDGIFIVGMPSLESQQHASPASRVGHINCKNGADLKEFCRKYFRVVFMFGMNDEVVHTGMYAMCHYLLAVCVGPR